VWRRTRNQRLGTVAVRPPAPPRTARIGGHARGDYRGRVGCLPAELQLLDSGTERLVFRAEADEAGVALLVDDDDLDELVGCVAAEANHEENRRRQRRLDEAFRILSAALDAPRP